MPSSLTLGALALVLGASSAGAQGGPSTLPDSVARRVDQVFARYDRQDSPGCALAVYRDGRIAYARGYGMANLEWRIPISTKTVFDIGSTSKQFTAMAVLMLAREGKLSLDDEVRTHVPELHADAPPVTVRQLILHTSGVRDYLTLMSLRGTNFDGVTTDRDALRLIARQRETNFAPGSEWLYSNSGYFLLGEIVRRTSGKSLAEFARERFFEPLGMSSTHFHDDHTMIVPNRATGYAPRAGGFEISMSGFEQTGDGAVMTTVEDLLRWDTNFYDAKVGGAALIAEAQVPGTLRDGKPLDYAAGLMIGRYRGLRTVRHGGSWAGYRAELLRFPEQRVSVACLCNLATANPSALADRVADAVLGGVMPEPARRDSAPPRPTAPAATAPATRAVNEQALAPLVGSYYSDELDATLRIEIDSGRLVLRLPDESRHPLAAMSDDTFGAERGVSVHFTRGADGRATTALLHAGRVRNIRLVRRE